MLRLGGTGVDKPGSGIVKCFGSKCGPDAETRPARVIHTGYRLALKSS